MKKRVVSLLLCLVMILSVFMTGCAQEEDDVIDTIIAKSSSSNESVKMWIVAEDVITAETAKAVTDAMNSITESALKVRVYIEFLTKDEYETKLGEAYDKYAGSTAFDDEAEEEEAPQVDPNKPFQPLFPKVLDEQVDIIYIEGEEMYTNFVAKGYLTALDNIISKGSKNKPLKEYISSVVLNAAKQDGKTTYAIPTNSCVGDYTYMLLNKELMAKYFYDDLAVNNKINGFYNEYVYNYLEAVYTHTNESGAKNDVVLIDGNYEECLDLLAYFWNVDGTNYDLLKQFSVFGKTYPDAASVNRGSVELGYGNLFADEAFTDGFLKLNEFDFKGFFGDADAAGKDAAIKFVTCDLLELDQYTEEYYPVVVKYPTLNASDLYDNGMFGVCSKAKNQERCMELITYMNTNVELRNLLAYGVKDVHYETTDREVNGIRYTVAYKLNNDYKMSWAKTGNYFVLYPLVDPIHEENSLPADIWETVKKQNFDAVIDPMLGFDLSKYTEKIDTTLVAYMNKLNSELVAAIDAARTAKDSAMLAALIAEIKALLDAESTLTAEDFAILKGYIESTDSAVANDLDTLRANLKKAMSKSADSETKLLSPYGAYASWLSSTGYAVKE